MTAPATGGPPLVVLAAGRAKRYGGPKPLAPVGVGGEAVIDLVASDALAAGFGSIVLVVGPETGDAVRYHVARTWPAEVDVHFAVQEAPRGTVDAVLAAAARLPAGCPFGVANADDVYGEGGLRALAGALGADEDAHAVVCYRLAETLVGIEPVTRGVCRLDGGYLAGIDERRKVAPLPDGRIVAHDGRDPEELGPDAWVSVNLWGFRPSILGAFEAAMTAAGADEVLLPEVVADLLGNSGAAGAGPVRAVLAQGPCIGVTHPGDLPLVQAALAGQVGRGERPAALWAPAVPRGR
jgi:NDP-sugar pyrophosphorylase family protein